MDRALLFLLLLVAVAGADEPPVVRHDLVVRLDPARHALEAVDRVDCGALKPPLRFRLHGALDVSVEGGELKEVGAPEGPVPLKEYELRPAHGAAPLVLRWRGTIHHPLVAEEQEYARSFSRTPGLISAEGVVLSGATYWVPHFEDALLTFRLSVELAEGWDVVSQGQRIAHGVADGKRHVTWECPHPMEEVYLIAAPFTEYARAAGRATAYAFLRQPDPALAGKYLETTAQYLEMYGKLLGPYPFSKFALVENFWETGYGMPSFTLLGPRVIRFPFILHSSYPHEILHNWWGNSVYVDWETGNWCEGLTAYLADHLIKEGQGGGEAYRRDTLKKYRAYVRGEKDFPLKGFRSRHSSATEAVGYGKSLMLFHMLRVRLGDERFVAGLRTFYARFKYRSASFGDLARVFSEVVGEDLAPFVAQWVERTGAPALALAEIAGGMVLWQTQDSDPYDLRVPVAFTVEGQPEARVVLVDVQGRETPLRPPAGTVRVDVDPSFDVFRLLDREEIPATLGEVFGADQVTIVLPREAGGWREFAGAWEKEGQVEVVGEEELKALPADRAVWILGADNGWAQALAPFLAPRKAGPGDRSLHVGAAVYPVADHSFVFTAPHPGNVELAVGWIGSAVPAALPGLARKLPHYGKYSYLAFAGDEPSNVAKGQWAATASPLVWHADRPRGTLPRRRPLARLAPVFSPARLMEHVRFLADERLQGRGAGTAELDEAALYLADAFEAAGLAPGGTHGSWFQVWEENDGPGGRPVKLVNVVGVLRGTQWPDQSVVVGAHYDHLGLGWPDVRQGHEGQVHPGADDNASGVAVLLELATLLGRQHRPQRTLVFVAFAGEEWGRRGSRHYVANTGRPAFAMVNLDTVGRLGGGKLTLLGSGTASEWRHIAMGVGYTTGVEAVCIPQDPGGSDQVSFHEAGVPAVQVFTGAHPDYHRPTDDVDKIDAAGLVKVATFVRETIVYLAERDRPLTSSLGKGKPPAPPGPGRRVSLGTLPDFGFAGPGVKVSSVLEGSPAQEAGIRGGDVLLAIDGETLADLRTFSGVLKKHRPGDVVRIRLRRGGKELTVEATLKAR
ncbi:MAG: M20/M25/M40 family metallo-hydrolase [Planctomycetota bacterium]|jgi:hypothetical protein